MKLISTENSLSNSAIWIVLLGGASILFSFALACATPFPALAALAALHMQRRDAYVVVAATWLANQFIGYAFLHYPQNWDSFAWGAMIGIASVAAVRTSLASRSFVPQSVATHLVAFCAAFVTYEAVLYATGILASDTGGFSMAIVGWILWVNALAFAGLLLIHGIGRTLGLATPATG
ncbi:MAG TPA: hypothetical protein VGM36_06900 [Rhizomicrobium sp.]